uniref:E3 ubiquitin protein ligase n=1 Tax=Heterorhabditis bacteriophora TaxID=37862 RepID=A0A1I7X2Y5_HETBA
MSKRSSPNRSDGSDDSQSGLEDLDAKRRRLNDIDEKKAKVQAYKLSELVRHKNKQLKGKDREIERLRQRQMTDENTSCTINRHWNNLDEQMRLIALRGASSEDVAELLEGAESVEDTYSRDFLGEIVQMEGDEGETVYDKRVQFRRVIILNVIIMLSVQLLDKVMQQSARKAEQFRLLSRKMSVFMEGMFVFFKFKNYLPYSLYVQEQSSIQSEAKALKSRQNGVSNGIGIDAAELDDLKAECEINADLAANRLQEIRELNEKIQKYAEDTARMEMCLKVSFYSLKRVILMDMINFLFIERYYMKVF